METCKLINWLKCIANSKCLKTSKLYKKRCPQRTQNILKSLVGTDKTLTNYNNAKQCTSWFSSAYGRKVAEKQGEGQVNTSRSVYFGSGATSFLLPGGTSNYARILFL